MNPEKSQDLENEEEEEEESPAGVRKPGSKAQGRKRTKTGCLSESTPHQSRGYL